MEIIAVGAAASPDAPAAKKEFPVDLLVIIMGASDHPPSRPGPGAAPAMMPVPGNIRATPNGAFMVTEQATAPPSWSMVAKLVTA
jgi:hypothetical protein